MSEEEVLAVARAGAAAGCHEALFTLGDKPELRYRVAREELRALGCETTLEYLARCAGLVLKETGRRLKASLRRGDTVARIGGDEFAVVVNDSGAGLDGVVERLRSELEKPYDLDGASVSCGASIGSAAFPSDGEEKERLLAVADERMYEEKVRRSGSR